MKIGSAIAFLLLALISLGYLLSENINTHQELNRIRQLNSQLAQEKAAIEEQLNKVTSEVNDLKQQNEVLSQEKLVLEGQIKQVQNEYSFVKEQNTQLQGQIDKMNKVNSIIEDLMGFRSNSLLLAFVIPILPISFGTSLLIYRYRKLHDRSPKMNADKSNSVFPIQVTKDEMKRIRQMRRHQ